MTGPRQGLDGPRLDARDPMASPVGQPAAQRAALDEFPEDDRRLVLSDLLNRVLDRGLVVTGSVTLAVADIDLVQLDLRLVLSAVESAMRRRGHDPERQ